MADISGVNDAGRGKKMIWAYLIHVGYNMWSEPLVQEGYYDGAPEIGSCRRTNAGKYSYAEGHLRFDRALWRKLAEEAAQKGVNMFVMDLGEAVSYESHPELACEGALSKEEIREEISFLKGLGIEPIPKLNFSACHDMWLGPYSKMLCTPEYYKVCADLISEVCELFSSPRLFHLGMDEEKASVQSNLNLIIERQGDLWWHDFSFLVRNVEKGGSQVWIWSDYMWFYEELFFERMPKEVLQSNWYYRKFKVEEMPSPAYEKYLKAFTKLADKCYDQVPTGSNWAEPVNFSGLAAYIHENVDNSRIKGFMQTVWAPTLPDLEDKHRQALSEFPGAIRAWNG
ncbi:MAG: hypothetical protein PHG48_07135 [Eubacteriales bacterium]|nr:hypothetical protein [Eubacteriales bacterium]